jgi:hypothetical protein
MDLVVIELVLWAALIFFFWALKDSLSRLESDIEAAGLLPARKTKAPSKSCPYARPDKVIDPIGSYRDAQIYRYAIIKGKTYQFDHVCPPEEPLVLQEGQCWLTPGLVYVETAWNDAH